MKLLKLLLLIFSFFIFFTGCNSNESSITKESKLDAKICPQCNMQLTNSKIHTATAKQNDDITYFDDLGCLILWSKEKNVDLKKIKTNIFSNDTKKYIDTEKAYYKIDEKTPMKYGFSAYEEKKDGTINFDEVMIRMLRGEHMANPKIRKQILGN